MEIQQLRHILAAIQHGNLGRAADDSNISHSGLSRSIKSLEDRFGVPLLVRNTRGVEPTLFGEVVARHAKVILNEVGRAMSEVEDLRAARKGQVTLGITQNYAHYLVPNVLADLHRTAPGLRVTVLTCGFLELVDRLDAGLIDLGFGLVGPLEETPEIITTVLREHHASVIANSRHPLVGRKVSAKDLAKAKWATLSSDGFQRAFAHFFQARALPLPQQVLRTDSIDLIRQTVSEIDVLTVFPVEVVRDSLASGALAVLDCDTPAELTYVGLMRRADSYVTPQMTLLIKRLTAAAA